MAWRADTGVNWQPARSGLRFPMLVLGVGAVAALVAFASLRDPRTDGVDPPAAAANEPMPRNQARSRPDVPRHSTAPRVAPQPRQAALPRRAPPPRGELRSASR